MADTGPLNYLIQIGCVNLLPLLVDSVSMPPEVLDELNAEGAPPEVRAWAQRLPAWAVVEMPTSLIAPDSSLSPADRAAISLAKEKQAMLLMDDRRARELARSVHNLVTIGTLGILETAAAKNLVSLPDAIHHLRQTTIFLSTRLIEQSIHRDAVRRGESNFTDKNISDRAEDLPPPSEGDSKLP